MALAPLEPNSGAKIPPRNGLPIVPSVSLEPGVDRPLAGGHSAASKFVGGGTGSDQMGKDVGDERRPEPSEGQGRMREADRGVGEKTETLRRAADGTQT